LKKGIISPSGSESPTGKQKIGELYKQAPDDRGDKPHKDSESEFPNLTAKQKIGELYKQAPDESRKRTDLTGGTDFPELTAKSINSGHFDPSLSTF
jgi:hypothetical protein